MQLRTIWQHRSLHGILYIYLCVVSVFLLPCLYSATNPIPAKTSSVFIVMDSVLEVERNRMGFRGHKGPSPQNGSVAGLDPGNPSSTCGSGTKINLKPCSNYINIGFLKFSQNESSSTVY